MGSPKSLFTGKNSRFGAAGVLFAAAIGAGFIPYFEGGYQACPSAIMGLTGGRSSSQAWYNVLSGGNCNSFNIIMFIIIAILLALVAVALVCAVKLGKRQGTAVGYPAHAANQTTSAAGVPAQPGHAPAGAAGDPSPYAGSGYPVPEDGEPADIWRAPAVSGGQGSGSFDTALLLAGLGSVAGVILVSLLVDWLAFLPGIVELLLWAAVAVTAIWQLKRRAAGTDQVKLAEAEAWNPAVVTRTAVAAGRHRLKIHQAQRREAERAQAFTPATRDQQLRDPVHPGPDVR